MAKTYSECYEELIQSALDNIEMDSHIEWDEAAREAIEDAVFRQYTLETHQAILDESQPHDEWQIYCDDMSDYEKVQEAMAYVAIRQDVIEHLHEAHGFEF